MTIQPVRASIHPRRRAILIGVLVAAVVLSLVLGLRARRLTMRRIQRGDVAFGLPGQPANDFDRFMALESRFLNGQGAYDDDGFPNPPIVIALLAPFDLLPVQNAQVTWALCKPVMSLIIVLLGLSMVRRAGGYVGLLPLCVILLTCFWPWVGDLQQGQTNQLMLLPLVAGLWMAQRFEFIARGRQGMALAAGVLIALAVCIKVTPLIFLIYFLWRRRFWVAAGIMAGIVCWLVVVPGILFGWAQNWHWLGQWYGIMIAPFMHGTVGYNDSQSLASLFKRLLTATPAFGTDHGDVYINLASLSLNQAAWLSRIVLGGSLFISMLWARRKIPSMACPRWMVEIGCVAAFMLWASERTWVHHYVTLFLPLLAAGMLVSDSSIEKSTRRGLWLAMIAMAMLMMFTSDVGKMFGTMGPIWIKSFGVCLLGSVAVVGGVVWAENRERRRGNPGYATEVRLRVPR